MEGSIPSTLSKIKTIAMTKTDKKVSICVVFKGGFQKRYDFNSQAHYEAWAKKWIPRMNIRGIFDIDNTNSN